jgi:hypothetical protein
MSGDIGAYDPQTAKMILETVRYLKANGLVIQGGKKKPPIFDAPRLYIAHTYTTVPARSGTTAGMGTANLKYIPGVAGTDDEIEGFPSSGTVEIDVYNIFATEIPAGVYVFIAREFASGKWVVVAEDCGV